MKKTLLTLLAGVALVGSAWAQTEAAPAKDATVIKPAVTGVAPAQLDPAAAILASPPAAGAEVDAGAAAGGAAGGAVGGAAAAGGAKVWVTGKTFHCEGSKEYGKTAKGDYMSLADAQALGAKAVGGQNCAQ